MERSSCFRAHSPSIVMTGGSVRPNVVHVSRCADSIGSRVGGYAGHNKQVCRTRPGLRPSTPLAGTQIECRVVSAAVPGVPSPTVVDAC